MWWPAHHINFFHQPGRRRLDRFWNIGALLARKHQLQNEIALAVRELELRPEPCESDARRVTLLTSSYSAKSRNVKS